MPTLVMFSTLIYQYCSIFKTHPATCFKRPLIIYNSRHVVNMCKNLLHCTVWETLAKQKTGPVESRCIDCPVSEPELLGSLEGKLVATKGQFSQRRNIFHNLSKLLTVTSLCDKHSLRPIFFATILNSNLEVWGCDTSGEDILAHAAWP